MESNLPGRSCLPPSHVVRVRQIGSLAIDLESNGDYRPDAHLLHELVPPRQTFVCADEDMVGKFSVVG